MDNCTILLGASVFTDIINRKKYWIRSLWLILTYYCYTHSDTLSGATSRLPKYPISQSQSSNSLHGGMKMQTIWASEVQTWASDLNQIKTVFTVLKGVLTRANQLQLFMFKDILYIFKYFFLTFNCKEWEYVYHHHSKTGIPRHQ